MEKTILFICTFFAAITVLFWNLVGISIFLNLENILSFFKNFQPALILENSQGNKVSYEYLLETLKTSPTQIQLNPRNVGVKLDPNNPNEWFREAKDGLTSSYIPEDPEMSSPEELFTAMNNYRSSHGFSILQSNGKLCEIANKRAVEADAHFSHDGFEKYIGDQNEFSSIAEVLYTGGKLSGVHIVEFGWDRSLTGHKETIRDSRWTHGCGGISGTTAVFIFGKHF